MGTRVSAAALALASTLAACTDDRISLHQAAKIGDLALVQAYLAEGSSVDEPDGGGFTPLHTSIMGNQPRVTRFLIERGADVNAAAIYGVVPLHVATDSETVRRLLT